MTDNRATLAALCERGPWTVNADGFAGATITGRQLVELYDSIAGGSPDFRGLGGIRSARPADRALQLLRRANLIEYAGTPKRWRVVGETSNESNDNG